MKAGRNDPCPCGSGKKFKKCCAQSVDAPLENQDTEIPGTEFKELLKFINAGRHAELESRASALVAERPKCGGAWKILGYAQWMQGRNSIAALEQAAALLPGDAEAQSNLGNAMRSQGRLIEAAALHRRAAEIRPDYAEALNNLGSVLRDLGQFDESVVSYRRAIAANSDFALAHNNLGNVMQSLGRHGEALASHRRALAIKPDFAEAHYGLGNALSTLGQIEGASASYRRATVMKPDFVVAHNALGNSFLNMGRPEKAVASYRRAIELDPGSVDAHANLGTALRDTGQFEAAVESYLRALSLAPHVAELHNNLGNAYFDLGLMPGAVDSYRRAIAIDPSFAKAHSNLAGALREIGRPAEAEASYRQAIVLQPEQADIYNNFAIALRLQGSNVESEEQCRKALELDPKSASAISFLAELHSDKGLFVQAEELFRRAIEIEPDLPQAWAGIAAARKMTGADNAWIEQALRIAESGLRPRDEVNLRYAIGKYFDDVKNFEQAFANYRRANELTKTYRPEHDRQHLTQTFDFVAQMYGKEWISQVRGNGVSSTRPVLVVGMPRSGTSLAEQILASHSSVFGAGELSFWKNASAGVADSMSVGDQGGRLLRNLGEDYLRLLVTLSRDAERVVDKMPGNFAHLGMIHSALPNARIIHMQRNPIDTCLSIYFNNFHIAHSHANDLEDLAHYYAEYLRIMRHWRSVLPAGAILDVPYEGLVDDQEAWSRRMLEFVGLPWDPGCMDFHQTVRTVSTFSKWQVRQKMTKTSVERWRNYEKFLGPLLKLTNFDQANTEVVF